MIIFLYGQDEYRANEKITQFKNKFINDVDKSGQNIFYLNGESENFGEISKTLSTSSLFSQKKMVIIRNIFSSKTTDIHKETLTLLKKIHENSEDIIVFLDIAKKNPLKSNKLFSFLLKQKLVQEFQALTNLELQKWIAHFVNSRGGTISKPAVLKIMAELDNNTINLSNELSKLVSYKNKEAIQTSDVEELTEAKTKDNIFALIDAISTKNTKLALELFENDLGAGQNEGFLMHMIIRQFKILLLVKNEIKNSETAKQIAGKLKLHPFVVTKSMSQAKNFSDEKLKSIFNDLTKLDAQIKSGKTNAITALEILIAKF